MVRRLLVQLLVFVLIAVNLELFFTVWLRVQNLETDTAIAQHDPRLGWRMKRFSPEDGVDGFRNPPVPLAKPSGELRLLSLGGSVTFGVGVSHANDAYPLQLQQLINAGGREPPAQVLNGGVPAFASHQYVGVLVDAAPKYNPDIVTVMCGFNENFADAYRRIEPDASRLIFNSHAYRDTISNLLYRSATYRWLLYQIGSSRPAAPPDAVVVKGDDLSVVRNETGVLTNSVDNLTIMARFVRSRGMRMLLLHEGHRVDLPEGMEGVRTKLAGIHAATRGDFLGFLDRLRDAHQEAARRLDIPFLEMNPGLKASGYSEDQLFLPRDAIHYTKLGNQVAASIIFARMQQLHWLQER